MKGQRNLMTINTAALLSELRNFDPTRYDGELDSMVCLYTLAHNMRTSYAAFNVEEPDWFTGNLKSVERSIRAANADSLERRQRMIELELESLKTRNEKKGDLQSQLDKIKQLKTAATT